MKETRVVLRNVGLYDINNVEEYRALGGYRALEQALTMDPQKIADEVTASGLIGRGGAAYPTGKKLNNLLHTPGAQKYVVCNADEGEPGTNKDRVIMSGDPHGLLEGMAIAGYTIGATKAYIYLRFEYPYIFPILEKAIKDAENAGYLGKNIFGSGFDFEIKVVSGGGAYVCGEETALLESIEGKRGECRFKPPYPSDYGVFGKPTLINNVETLCNLAPIIENGYQWYKSLGRAGASGTKVYSLSGNVVHRGVYEFPEGTNLKEIIYGVGGGIANGRKLLAVQCGGASGPIINADMIDVPFREGVADPLHGASHGAGDIMVIDDTHDILDILENLMEFFTHESCGKCTPCREGTTRLLQYVRKFKNYEATEQDLDTLEDLAVMIRDCSLCGLGQAAPVPVISTLSNFQDVYIKSIVVSELKKHPEVYKKAEGGQNK